MRHLEVYLIKITQKADHLNLRCLFRCLGSKFEHLYKATYMVVYIANVLLFPYDIAAMKFS